MRVGNSNLDVEVASTPGQIEQGLMYRDSLDHNAGMLFAFPEAKPQSFWMRNTKIPLSIAFLDDAGTIFDMKDMNPHDETPVQSGGPAKYALEVNRGWFDKNNVRPGDSCGCHEAMIKEQLMKVITEEVWWALKNCKNML